MFSYFATDILCNYFIICHYLLTSLPGAEGLRFKSRADQIGHSVANGSLPLRHFENSFLPAAITQRWDLQPVTRSGVKYNKIVKDLFCN